MSWCFTINTLVCITFSGSPVPIGAITAIHGYRFFSRKQASGHYGAQNEADVTDRYIPNENIAIVGMSRILGTIFRTNE